MSEWRRAADARNFQKRSRRPRAKYFSQSGTGPNRNPNSELAILRGFPLKLLPRRPRRAHHPVLGGLNDEFSRICYSQVRVSKRVLFLSHSSVRMHASQNSVKGKSSLLKFKPTTVNHGVRRRTPGGGLPDYEWAQLSSCRHDRLETFIAIRALTISKYHNHLRPLNHLLSQNLGGHHRNVVVLYNIKSSIYLSFCVAAYFGLKHTCLIIDFCD